MNLEDKLEFLQDYANEFSLGWDDSGCFWHFTWGSRGSGRMIEGCGNTFSAIDAETCELHEAVDQLLDHLKVTWTQVGDWKRGREKKRLREVE
jgi:hypothetical protein